VSLTAVKRYVDGQDVGWLNRRLMMLIFRSVLIKRAYSLEEVRRMSIEAGWNGPRIDAVPLGFEAWLSK
jgi:hypothetical protein